MIEFYTIIDSISQKIISIDDKALTYTNIICAERALKELSDMKLTKDVNLKIVRMVEQVE
jgi:hypothetical protein